jgi:hypothetical protein
MADIVHAMLYQALDPATEILFDDNPQFLTHLREPGLLRARLIR